MPPAQATREVDDLGLVVTSQTVQSAFLLVIHLRISGEGVPVFRVFAGAVPAGSYL